MTISSVEPRLRIILLGILLLIFLWYTAFGVSGVLGIIDLIWGIRQKNRTGALCGAGAVLAASAGAFTLHLMLCSSYAVQARYPVAACLLAVSLTVIGLWSCWKQERTKPK